MDTEMKWEMNQIDPVELFSSDDLPHPEQFEKKTSNCINCQHLSQETTSVEKLSPGVSKRLCIFINQLSFYTPDLTNALEQSDNSLVLIRPPTKHPELPRFVFCDNTSQDTACGDFDFAATTSKTTVAIVFCLCLKKLSKVRTIILQVTWFATLQTKLLRSKSHYILTSISLFIMRVTWFQNGALLNQTHLEEI